jgi:hypothetical protein
VSEKTSEPSSAKMTVNAIGRNSLPSTPSRVRIGKYTVMMISSPNSVGRRTSIAASATTPRLSRGLPPSWAR